MATTFLEPGGDATGNVALTSAGGFWGAITGTPTAATDFVHGTHNFSIKCAPSQNQIFRPPLGVIADSGSRISFWIYLNALPSSATAIIARTRDVSTSPVNNIQITTAGVIQLTDGTPTILGSGPTLSTGQWYRVSLAYTIASTTVNRFELFVNGTSAVSVTNATLARAGTTNILFGNISTNTIDIRYSDFYIDTSSSLTDPGNIWVSAKRPFSNGTTNGFTTQIGAGGSGYGSGHAPQVNEVPLSTTNGWSMIGAGGAVTEEYTIEGQSVGFVSTAGGTIIDFEGWVDASSVTSETASIIVAGSTSNISLTSTDTVFTKIAGSSTYPVGGTDIGIVTGTTLTTVGLYECGIMVAFIPAATTTGPNLLSLLGAG